jgi:NADPH:quinone reductase-like Zn-dependent oxidoreductase
MIGTREGDLQAAVMRGHGGPEVLRLDELPRPDPAWGEVRVRVRACALNHLDLWTRRGLPGLKLHYPHVLGNDIAGEIDALGEGVDGLTVGQRAMLAPGTSCGHCRACLAGEDNACRAYRVLGHHVPGGYAEFVVVPRANVIPLPEGFGFEEAAAFPLVFLTAWHMLVTRAQVRLGEDVLVWAAGSGVGVAAIQIAKLFGARVIATAGNAAKLELARSLGADEVLDHHAQDVPAEVRRLTGRKGVEVVVEHVGQATWERSILSLAHRGRLVTCGATTGPQGLTELRHLFAKQLSLLGSYMGGRAELLDAARFFFERRLRTHVHVALPLSEARQAHEIVEASQHFGKVVLLP